MPGTTGALVKEPHACHSVCTSYLLKVLHADFPAHCPCCVDPLRVPRSNIYLQAERKEQLLQQREWHAPPTSPGKPLAARSEGGM